MTLQTERVRTLDQVRAFVEGSETVSTFGFRTDQLVLFMVGQRMPSRVCPTL